RPMRLGGVMLASSEDAPAPVFFESDLRPQERSRAHAALLFASDLPADRGETRIRISRGETFVDALKRAGIRAEDRNEAAYAFGRHYNLRRLLPGQEFVLQLGWPNQTLFQLASGPSVQEARLLGLEFRSDAENRIIMRRGNNGALEAEKAPIALTTRMMSVAGRINGSLYISAKDVGAPDQIIADLADAFSYDVDFQREIRGGDEFEAIFEVQYDDRGELVSTGDILFARLSWRGGAKEKGYYRFAADMSGRRADYYDATGQSAKRLLMKTPIDGARLSSGFGTRRHPILGYRRAHKGVDFAAPRGTPIKAAGDGVVERADRYGSFGNYIRIRHSNGYKTAYAHLNGFARGVRKGRRVEQGDIIGYVGTTGRSTGPHLHYEVHLNGQAVNPQRLKIAATGKALAGADLDRFKAHRDMINAMRAPAEDPETLFAKEEGREKNAL
ncbi:MAG: peptidoglycan DD-metalloendopeptidase family protein, partial [Hyphococcus sp.]